MAGCVVALAPLGCSQPTSLLMSLSLGKGVPAPQLLRIRLYGAGELGAPALLALGSAGKQLPGTVVVGPLDPGIPDFRVLVDGLDAQGALMAQVASRLQIIAGQQMRASLVLMPPSADSDGDGVPDAIDDCTQLFDPDQRCGRVPDSDGAVITRDAGDGGIVPIGGGGDDEGSQPDLAIDPSADLSVTPGAMDLSVVKPPHDLASPFDLTPRLDLSPAPDLGRCNHAGLLFCDDFETGDDSKWTSRVDGVPGKDSLTIDNTHANGAFAIDAKGLFNPNNQGTFTPTSYYLYKDFTPGTATTLSARAYVWVPTTPGTMALTFGLYKQLNGFAVGVDESNNWAIQQDQGSSPDLHGNIAVSFGQWVCVELVLDIGRRLRLYVNNALALDKVPALGTVPTQLQAGLLRGPGNVATEFYVDDVALGKAMIGCQ